MPIRNQLLKLLENYNPIEEHQLRAKEQIIDFIMDNPRCFLRSSEEGHITGSVFLLNPNLDEVLLTHHKKIGKWLQLGGHADGDPDIFAVAMREAREESGINDISPLSYDVFDVDIHAIDQHKGVPAHFHYDIRFVLKANNISYKVSGESHDLAWVPLRQIALWDDGNESLVRMANKWIKAFEDKALIYKV